MIDLKCLRLSKFFQYHAEPDVASSDATNMECTISREGSEVVINGRKWWSSGNKHHCCRVFSIDGHPVTSSL